MADVEGAAKALALARKHDAAGNTEGAIKWARKSVAIGSTPEATSLLRRLETEGARPAASSSSSSTQAQPSTPKPASSSSSTTLPEEQEKRAYTHEQVQIVRRIHSAAGDYYACLGVEKTVTDTGIKKAYKKLALQLHPDKNAAPGADEAFKLVSKAFTVLSDTDKRAMYDRYGGDPEQRASSGPSASAASAFARGRPGMFTEEVNPEDLFNAFFGNGGFSPGGATFTFGGPGMSFHAGGPGIHRRRQNGPQRARQPEQQSWSNILIQLLPLLLLAAFSLLSLAPQLFTTPDPQYRYAPSGTYTHHRFTPRNGVSYYVDQNQWSQHPFVAQRSSSNGGLKGFEHRVESDYAEKLSTQCSRFRELQQRRLQSASGFFGIGADPAEVEKIRNERYEACERLQDFTDYL